MIPVVQLFQKIQSQLVVTEFVILGFIQSVWILPMMSIYIFVTLKLWLRAECRPMLQLLDTMGTSSDAHWEVCHARLDEKFDKMFNIVNGLMKDNLMLNKTLDSVFYFRKKTSHPWRLEPSSE